MNILTIWGVKEIPYVCCEGPDSRKGAKEEYLTDPVKPRLF